MTQYVYILIAHENNAYASMCLISALSVRGVDAQAKITVLSDGPTLAMLTACRHQLLEVADDVQDCGVDEAPRFASRILKTTMLPRLKTDFIFLDVDTIVTRPIAFVLRRPYSLQMVLDRDSKTARTGKIGFPSWAAPYYVQLGWKHPTRFYFNSGVMFVHADAASRQLFEEWHRRWRDFTATGRHLDQLALNSAAETVGLTVGRLPLRYNAVVRVNEAYRWGARILHFYGEGQNLDAGTPYADLVSAALAGQRLTSAEVRSAARRRWPLVEPWSLMRHVKAGSLRGAVRRFASALRLLPKRDWQGFIQRLKD